MIRLQYIFLVSYFLVTSGLSHGQETKTSRLGILSKSVIEGNANNAQAISQGISLVESGSSLEDEMPFMYVVAHQGGKDSFERLLQVLSKKYSADNNSIIQVYVTSSAIYRDEFNDQIKSVELLNDADRIQESVECDRALNQMRLWQQLADDYLLIPNPTQVEENRKKSFYYLGKIVEFNVYAPPYFSRIGEFRTIQRSASLRLLEISPLIDVSKLRLPLFVYPEVERLFPEKAKFLGVPIEVRRFNDQLSMWLDLKIKDEPKNSQLRSHLQAVLNSLKSKK